jgi:poly(A) polymerase
MGIAPEVYDAMVEHRGELARAAKPRVFEEVLRLLRGGAAHRSIYLAWDIGVLAEILPEVACYLDDGLPETDLTWRRLAAVDRRHAEGALPTDAVLLAALLYGPVHEALEDARDMSTAFEEFMEEVALRLAIPRRMKERMCMLMMAQKRMHQGKLGSLARRDYFPEAAELYAIDCEAAGREVPEWVSRAAGQPLETEDGEHRRRRRRRRRRRPDLREG